MKPLSSRQHALNRLDWLINHHLKDISDCRLMILKHESSIQDLQAEKKLLCKQWAMDDSPSELAEGSEMGDSPFDEVL